MKTVANNEIELGLAKQGYSLIAGCDESGMGAFAGSLYVAVTVFELDFDYQNLLPGLNDSKQKTEALIQRIL